jgi:transposase-like protein
MKGKRFTDEQIAYALRQAEGGTPVADVCRQLGVSEASFYLWKKKYAKMGLTEIRELRDPTADSWTTVAPMSSPRAEHIASLQPDGSLLVDCNS